MSGERMNQIYVMVCLGQVPQLKDEEERTFYNNLVKEMAEKKQKSEEPIQWVIPSE